MTPEAKIETGLAHAAGIFTERGENVITQLDEALRAGNSEGIHDLRVAIRRLRTAMRDLAYLIDKRSAGRVNAELKTVAALAGKVRDNDVAIAVLGKFTVETTDQDIILGLNEIAAGRRVRRDADLLALSELLSADRTEELSKLIRSLSAGPDAAIPTTRADAVLRERRSEFLELVPTLYDPADIEGHHRLRIATKRLRYSVELFDETRRGEQKSTAERIAVMQDHLGDMHDCDVWVGTLRKGLKKYLKNSGAPTPEFLAAEWLLGEFVRRRAKNYREALELWTEWRNTDFLGTLATQ